MSNDANEYARVSIHAPVRERREVSWIDSDRVIVSIHAPVRERRSHFGLHFRDLRFQSTPP